MTTARHRGPRRAQALGRTATSRRSPAETVADTADMAALLRAAHSVRDELRRDGLPLTRDALAAGLRASGHPARNERLTPLLTAFRGESQPPSTRRQRSTAA